MNQAEAQELINKLPTVDNIKGRNGTPIKNQFIIIQTNTNGDYFELFQSYKSPIALKFKGKVFLFRDWNYSATTSKYRNQFLGVTTKETQQKIKDGEYILIVTD